MRVNLKNEIQKYLRFLRLTAFDVSTEDGKRHERYRRTMLSGLTSIFSRGVSLISNFLIIYISVPLLGAHQYSIWIVVTTFCTVITMFDAGIPVSMINVHAHATSLQERQGKTQFSILILLLVSLTTLTIGIVAFLFFPITFFLSQDIAADPDKLRDTLLYSAPTIFIQIMNVGCSNILFGMQKSHISNILNVITALISLALTATIGARNPTPLVMIWTTQIAQLLVPIVIIIYLFATKLIIFPGPKIEFGSSFYRLIQISRSYFILNGVSIATGSMDSLFASMFLSSQDLSDLSTVQRLFFTLSSFVMILVTPLWSAYAEAFAQRDLIFIRNTLKRSVIFCIGISLVLCVPIIVLSNSIFMIWTKGTLSPDFLVICFVAIATSINSIIGTISLFMNGCSIMRPQITMNLYTFVISAGLKFAMTIAFGLEGLIAAGLIATILVYGIGYGFLYRKVSFGWLFS